MDILILLSMGGLAGMMAGLLGIGGGALIVPVLVLVFEAQGVDSAVIMHAALGTSLATIVFTAISSTLAHHRRGAVDWQIFKQLAPGLAIATFLGAFVADHIENLTLRLMFIVFMIGIALQMARGSMATRAHVQLPPAGGMFTAGSVIGLASSLFGIGGGSLAVPFLTWCSVPVKRAVATAAAVGIPVATFGTLGYIFAGLQKPNLPALSLGYVVLPAFAGVVVASTLAAPLGARIAHKLPDIVLKRIFAGFVCVLAARMLWGMYG